MMIQKLNTNWRMRQSGTEEWLPAQVPGGVYEDYLAAGKMEDPFWKDNENYALEMMEHDYEYGSLFDLEPELLQCDKVMLHFYGLDTIADITLNGHLLGHVENMHREWDFDVKEILKEKENKLEIHFYSPNKWIAEAYAEHPTRGTEDAMDGFVHLRKAHCSFGWDWGPHMPNAGIWREVELRGINGARIDSVYIEQQHEENTVILKLHPEILFVDAYINQKEDFTYSVTVKKPDGSEVSADASPEMVLIKDPQLWWPNNLGDQPLYTITVALKYRGMQIDSWTRRIGLRTMTVKREKDQWGETFAFTCNGISFFSMGADYIPEDQLHGRVTPEVTRKLLEKAKFANFNSIRVWGGGHYPDDWFYDLCVSNETMEAVEGTVRWQIRNADAVILREEEEKITIPVLTSKWMEKVDLPDVDLFNEYVSYQFIREGCCVSEGTVIFSYPKYFNYQDPKLSVRCEGDEIVVTASAYAKSVEISNEMDDLYLSDNFFDMNAGEKRVKILAGETKGLKVRSVYDIQ